MCGDETSLIVLSALGGALGLGVLITLIAGVAHALNLYRHPMFSGPTPPLPAPVPEFDWAALQKLRKETSLHEAFRADERRRGFQSPD